MRVFALGLFALFSVAPLALAAEEPTGFRDIPFGAREADIREKYPNARCAAAVGDEQNDDVSCTVTLTIGDVPVFVLFTLVGEPMQRRMMNVTLSFDSDNFAKISQAFTDRYGPPTDASRQRETVRWMGPKTVMFVSKSSAKLGRGFAAIGLREFMELTNKRQQEQREKAKKDL